MNSYLAKNLNSGENLLILCKPHWIIYSMPASWFFVGVLMLLFGNQFSPTEFYTLIDIPFYKLFAIVSFIFCIITSLTTFLVYLGTEFAVTDQRVMMKYGIIRRTTIEIQLQRIESVSFDQSIFGRLFDYGTIHILGTGGSRDSFRRIPHPQQFQKKLLQVLT